MSGYTITLTDSEYDALKARISSLEESLAKYQACRVHDVDEKAYLSKRVTELEAENKALKDTIRSWTATALETEGDKCG